MDYQWHYNRLIETRKDRILTIGEYYENHHIVPRSMGGSNDNENLIKLTLREHFIAHLLLWKIHRNRSMAAAFVYMTGNMRKQNFVLSSRMYEQVKIAARENGQANKGIHLTKKHKQKISESLKGKNIGKPSPFKNQSHTSESKEKLSILAKTRVGDKNSFYGKTHSVKTRNQMAESWKTRGPVSDETKQKLSMLAKGLIWINKEGCNKKIQPDKLSEWITLGWIKGKVRRS